MSSFFLFVFKLQFSSLSVRTSRLNLKMVAVVCRVLLNCTENMSSALVENAIVHFAITIMFTEPNPTPKKSGILNKSLHTMSAPKG